MRSSSNRTQRSPRKLFALDQNFPEPILRALATSIVEAELVSIRSIDPRMSEFDDWAVLHGLHCDVRDWDGLITSDSRMLRLPREVSVLIQTKLTLVVAVGAGHDPIKATGLLLTHLPEICKRSDRSKPQAWSLNAKLGTHTDPWDLLKKLAEPALSDPKAVFAQHKLSDVEFAMSPLGAISKGTGS